MRPGLDHRSPPPPPPRAPLRFDDPAYGPRRMEHAHESHFLSRALRCEGADMDRAMHLYHHSSVVRGVVERLLREQPDAERVSVPLREAGPSPRVILTRGGRFVTCLDESMACTDIPELPYERFAEAITRVHERRADLARRLKLLRRFDGRDMGTALLHGPGRFHRAMAEVFVDGGDFGQGLCDWLIKGLKLFNRYSALHVRGLMGRREAIEYTKLEGQVVLLCYLLAGVQSPGVAGILDYLSRRETGYHEELMLALSRQADGDERLLAIATDAAVPPQLRGAACTLAFASLSVHCDRAQSIVERVLALPPDPALPRLPLLQERARALQGEAGASLTELAEAVAQESQPVRPAAAYWVFSGAELLQVALGGRPALELFAPEDEAKGVSEAWDLWVRTRPIPPPPKREPVVRTAPRVGRNEPCPCGSGRKHKHCCLGRPAAAAAPPAP